MTKYLKGHFAAVALLMLLFVGTAHADTVALTGGTASTLAGVGTVNLLGLNFSLHYVGEIPPGVTNMISMNTALYSIGTANVSFNGVGSGIFRGVVSFDDSFLSGTVSAYATMDDMFFNRPALFTVGFNGYGYITVTDVGGQRQTQFNVSVPEPNSLLLLFSGLGGLIAFRRRQLRPQK